MPRKTEFISYKPKTILNKNKRADHWFWTRYSAYPYLGCQHGCEFCYCREQKFSPYDDADDFAYKIKVKENAPELLRKALFRAKTDLIFIGDYQPAERKFELSRKMLEVCRERNFPVFILERSPLILRDIELLQDIESRARAVVAFSIIHTKNSPNYEKINRIERLAPPPEKRFEAMEKIASAGIMTGTSMMPLLPELCDDDANLEDIIRQTADSGGRFVLASGLTLSDQQRAYFFNYLAEREPQLLSAYEECYPRGKSYGAVGDKWCRTALKIREFCEKHGISDRMPRPIIDGDKRAKNKRIVEIFANKVYNMELERVSKNQIWAYRKAAWAIEDMEQDIALLYRMMGIKGLEKVPDIGKSLAKEVELLLIEMV